jgi:hypothetical protein
VVADRREMAAAELARAFGATPEQVLGSVHFLVGTVDIMVAEIQRWREEYGISYISVIQPYMDVLAPVVARLAGR